MKNSIFLLAVITILFASCEKRANKQVKYVATDAISEYTIQYRDANGDIQNESIQAESAQDKWQKTLVVEQGEIVYLSGKYNDPESALKLMIYIDGKVYKQGSSVGDTLKYLIVSGMVPY
jgi:hypothetical protein